jgi:hypothetical protein
MIIRIDGHRQGIRKLSYRVRRLQHLAGVQGMKIGVIVAQTFCSGGKDITELLGARHSVFKFREMLETFVQGEQSIRHKFKILTVQESQFVVSV